MCNQTTGGAVDLDAIDCADVVTRLTTLFTCLCVTTQALTLGIFLDLNPALLNTVF